MPRSKPKRLRRKKRLRMPQNPRIFLRRRILCRTSKQILLKRLKKSSTLLKNSMKRLSLSLALAFLLGAALLFTATTTLAQTQTLPEGVTQVQMDAALSDLSTLYGSPVTRVDQAKAICNQEQYFVECAQIGQKHGLFPEERAEQVDALLTELKGAVVDELKQCGSTECLVTVATAIARRLSAAHPSLARTVDLTPQKVEEKRTIVEAAKSVGVDIEECQSMDPDNASLELLRACAKLAKHKNVQKYIPTEDREKTEKSDNMI